MLAALALGCGGGSDGDGPAGPTPTPARTPTPVVTPTPVPVVLAPMALAASGTVRGVNARESIAVVQRRPTAASRQGVILLPPDAIPTPGHIPVLGCPLSPPDPAARRRLPGRGRWNQLDLRRGDLDHTERLRGPGRKRIRTPRARPPRSCRSASSDIADAVRVGPGPCSPVSGDTETLTPLCRHGPDLAFTRLPSEGFSRRAEPWQSDAQSRIVGSGLEPLLPVLWLPEATATAPRALAAARRRRARRRSASTAM